MSRDLWRASGVLKVFGRTVAEEAGSWLLARPRLRNRIDEANANRFFETGHDLIEEIVEAIACGQHVALAGPRGCGKSYCITEAIKRAGDRGLIPRNGSVKIQGNKELPRDYLIEDDMTLSVGDDGVVTPKRKNAPLFRFAKRSDDEEVRGRPLTAGKDVVCYGVDDMGRLDETSKLKRGQHIVLFLDEVNRFSDGVLDSLLLLLEEGEAVMGGDVFRLPVVVLMTMNPPGYDASARALSPPLSARIGRQYRLLSPRLDVLTDVIAAKILDRLTRVSNDSVKVQSPARMLVRRAAAVTLCAWGLPRGDGPGLDYLSPETKALIGALAGISPQLIGAMGSLNGLCHFGPDGRALGDWIIAATVAAVNQAKALGQSCASVGAEHFVDCAVTVLSHKLQDNFSSASRPDNTRRKEEALYIIASTLMRSTDPHIDRILWRAADFLPKEILDSLMPGSDPEELRTVLLKAGVTDRTEIGRWQEFLKIINNLLDHDFCEWTANEAVRRALLEVGLLERDEGGEVLSATANREVLRWISDAIRRPSVEDPLRMAFCRICTNTGSYSKPVEHTLADFVFVREGVLWCDERYNLRLLIRDEKLDEMPRHLLIELFKCCDAVWIKAEHEWKSAAEELWSFLAGERTDIPLPKHLRTNAMAFAERTLTRMERRTERGGGTRRVRRLLSHRVEAYHHHERQDRLEAALGEADG